MFPSYEMSRSLLTINLRMVEQMQQGRPDCASSLFEEGLGYIVSQLDQLEDADRSPQKQGSGLQKGLSGSFHSFHIPMVLFPDSQEEAFVLFSRALHPSLNADALQSSDLYSFYLLLSITFLYNAGLMHHISGLRLQNSQMLSKAVGLYTMAYNTLSEQWGRRSDQTSDLPRLLKLACVNNAGHIYSFMRDLAQAGLCSDEISLLLLEASRSESCGTVSSMAQDEFDLFMLNVRFFDRTACASAA